MEHIKIVLIVIVGRVERHFADLAFDFFLAAFEQQRCAIFGESFVYVSHGNVAREGWRWASTCYFACSVHKKNDFKSEIPVSTRHRYDIVTTIYNLWTSTTFLQR